ncbi:MAG: TRAP transporter fused permease subunit [Burkholderiaceae bacterium]
MFKALNRLSDNASGLVAFALSAFAIYIAGFGVFDNSIVSATTVGLALLVGLLTLNSRLLKETDSNRLLVAKYAGLLALIALSTWIMWNWLFVMLEQEEFFIEIEHYQLILAWLGFAIIGLLTYLYFGMPMLAIYVLMAVYVLTSSYFPGALEGSSEEWTRVAENIWYSTDGVFGRPVEVVSRIVLIFIIFGAVLQTSGAGATLLKFAFAATGRFVGGPAHASIVGSALFGTMNGAAVANVVSTGVFTIPIIKKAGYKPSIAGAIEAAASTGGQIMPPVMGVVAFLMADITGIPYLTIVVAAIVPALFYYASLFIVALLEARKGGMTAIPEQDREYLTRADWMKSLSFFIPLGIIVGVLITGRTPQAAGFYALIAAFVMSLICYPSYRSVAKIIESLVTAGRTCATLMLIVAAIGLVLGVVNMTGIGIKFAEAIMAASGDGLFFSLILVMLGCLALGMGVPTGAAYLIIAIIMGPALEQLGLPTLTAHLFVVYFGVLSAVTPPVALAAFAAAPIAGAPPMETAVQAVRMAIAGFIIPFVFVYHPSVLLVLEFDPAAFVWAVLAYGLCTWSLASALAGFDTARLGITERILRGAAGLLTLVPQASIALPAALVAIALLLYARFTNKRVLNQ